MNQFQRKGTYSDLGPIVINDLWSVVNSCDVIYAMQVLSDFGLPAVLGAEKKLIDQELMYQSAQRSSPENDRKKMCFGAMVRQVMEENGYQLMKGNPARTRRSKIFSTASRYTSINET